MNPPAPRKILGAGGRFYVPALRGVMNRVTACVIVPPDSFTDCDPFRFRTLVVDVCQTATIVERIISNVRHAVSDRYACQSATIKERIISNACYAVRDSNGFQIHIVLKSTIRII